MMMLLIATPVRGGGLNAHVTVGYSEHVRKLSRTMPFGEVPALSSFVCDVVRARNRIAAKVIRDGIASHVLWWDDDEWPEDVGIVKRMIATMEDFIAAPYTNKTEPIRWHHQSRTLRDADSRGLLEVDYVAMGFTMTTVECLRRVSEPARKYTDYPTSDVVADIFGLLYDGPGDETDSLMSEDYSFCKRWRDVGGRIWVDGRPGNIVHHVGARAYSARDIEGGVK